MRRIPVISFTQNTKKLIMFACNPIEIVDLCNFQYQDYSNKYYRPCNITKVKENANFLSIEMDSLKDLDSKESVNGLLPTSVVLNLKDPFEIDIKNGIEYLLFPENEREKEIYRESIEIIDGMKRIMAFNLKLNNCSEKDNLLEYKIGFIALFNLTEKEKMEIFLSINENQEKLDKNSIMQLKLKLDLLDIDEVEVYKIIDKLNISNLSPLQGKIIMSNEKTSNGIKMSHLSKILIKSKTYDCLKSVDNDVKIKIILNYLNAWNTVYYKSYMQPKHILNKIAGIRYIFYLFTYFYKAAEYSRKPLTQDNLTEIIYKFYINNNGDDMFYDSKIGMLFRSEGMTISLAKKQGDEFVDLILGVVNNFDPTNI